MAISVEDVRAFREFIVEQVMGKGEPNVDSGQKKLAPEILPLLQRLVTEVHPLALGNVHRVLQQIKQLAGNLLRLHPMEGENPETIVTALTTEFYSHVHMINRYEAQAILGQRVEFASADLAAAMDDALRAYEDKFGLRRKFYLSAFLGGNTETEVRFIGGVLEGVARSYVFETKGMVRQVAKPPANVQIQVPIGQPIPLVPGMPRETQVEVRSQGWVHNKEPLGVTI